MAEQLLDGEAEALIRLIVYKAKQGDMIALRMCFDRLLPPRRDRPVPFAIPALSSANDAAKVAGAITVGVARGELTTREASELAHVLEVYVKAVEVSEIESRLEALEKGQRVVRESPLSDRKRKAKEP